jgi:hypothetical protein
MRLLHSVKRVDQFLSKVVVGLIAKSYRTREGKKSLCLTYSVGSLNGVEDRVTTYFGLLTESENSKQCNFKLITLKGLIPSFFYSLQLLRLSTNCELRFLLIDYNVHSRFPSLSHLKILGRLFQLQFVWMESFERDNATHRILPCIVEKSLHVITDDPSLRILQSQPFADFADQFIFFPAPFLPRKFFIPFDKDERNIDVSFFGAVDDSLGHAQRRKYLQEVSRFLNVHGFQSFHDQKKNRPSYFHMISDLRNSKIGLNFSNHGGVGALTNRVTETIASGAVLVSTSEKVLSDFLEPGVHYLKFSDEVELTSSIQEILHNCEKARQVSENAQNFYLSRYTAEHFVELLAKHS